MKTKQIVGIVVAGIVFIAVCVSGMFSNVIAGNMAEKRNEKAKETLTSALSSVTNEDITLPEENFIGVLDIVGTIQASSGNSMNSAGQYDHDRYMDFVDKMEKSSKNKGILLYVNSPGGSVYESDELYLKLMEYKKQTGRPVWAYFANQACSGAYYISMAADKIYANRNGWTGSIGVIISLMNCKKLYDKIGIKEIDVTSGKNKAMGSSGLDLTKEQRDILQSLVDEAYDQFVGIVSEGRSMDEATVRKLADGRIYSAKQAMDTKLIDKIDSLPVEKKELANKVGDANITFFKPETDSTSKLLSKILGIADHYKKKSQIDLAEDIMNNKGNGVLQYYAK